MAGFLTLLGISVKDYLLQPYVGSVKTLGLGRPLLPLQQLLAQLLRFLKQSVHL